MKDISIPNKHEYKVKFTEEVEKFLIKQKVLFFLKKKCVYIYIYIYLFVCG